VICSLCRALAQLKSPGLGGLGRAWAHKILELDPGPQLGLGWAGLRLKSGIQSDDEYIDIARK